MADKVKTILITQQDPGAEKNPYVDLAKKHKLKRALLYIIEWIIILSTETITKTISTVHYNIGKTEKKLL